MTSSEPIPPAVLKRKAVVYVRQSSPSQVLTNLESKRRQYDLVEVARQRGFVDVEVIDDDLGRSASGTVARPGFDRLVAWLCAGKVGAVLCFDASRLARNGRDWHHLLELCGLVEARVIDLDGVYNPCRPNDRLLLGMKGSISEFELGVLRARMIDAARSKAGRGELRISVPFGYVWHREVGLGLDPDQRLQEVIRLIFARFRELSSARQVLLSMAWPHRTASGPVDARSCRASVRYDRAGWAPSVRTTVRHLPAKDRQQEQRGGGCSSTIRLRSHRGAYLRPADGTVPKSHPWVQALLSPRPVIGRARRWCLGALLTIPTRASYAELAPLNGHRPG